LCRFPGGRQPLVGLRGQGAGGGAAFSFFRPPRTPAKKSVQRTTLPSAAALLRQEVRPVDYIAVCRRAPPPRSPPSGLHCRLPPRTPAKKSAQRTTLLTATVLPRQEVRPADYIADCHRTPPPRSPPSGLHCRLPPRTPAKKSVQRTTLLTATVLPRQEVRPADYIAVCRRAPPPRSRPT
jgi:hypothetical protein